MLSGPGTDCVQALANELVHNSLEKHVLASLLFRDVEMETPREDTL